MVGKPLVWLDHDAGRRPQAIIWVPKHSRHRDIVCLLLLVGVSGLCIALPTCSRIMRPAVSIRSKLHFPCSGDWYQIQSQAHGITEEGMRMNRARPDVTAW